MNRQNSFGALAGRPYTEAVQLLEREDELGVLHAALEGAVRGQGSGIALAGDSGVGKSTLIEALCQGVTGARVLRGHCDPLDTPRPLGPFRDLQQLSGIDGLGRGEDLLLSEVCEQVYAALGAEPTVLVVEDLHWVDAASVDVLRFLARRIESMPLALIVSYRNREIGARHSARPLLGDVASLDGLSQLELKPLSVDAVRLLLEGTHLEAERVHAVTGGNPFFVAEVAKEPDLPLPVSVRDAVLARTSQVTPHDFEVLQLVATAPDRLDDRVLPALGVDLPTLRRLDETALLTRTAEGIVFRHELARQAIESTVPPGGGPRLHALLLDALERVEPRDPAVLTHHAVGARDAPRAARYAREAGQDATRAGSHSEAAAFFETALEHLDSDDPRDRAGLLLQLADQQYMTSRLREAIDNVSATFQLWEEAGDRAGLAAAHNAVAVFEYYNARRRQAEAHSGQAARIATDSDTELAYAAARTTQGYLALMRSDVQHASEYAAQAHRVADAHHQGQLSLRSEVVSAASGLAVRRRRGPHRAARPRRERARPRLGRARLNRLLPGRQPRCGARPVPRGRAAAATVDPLRDRARHPDLSALADRGAVPSAPPAGSLERRSGGRRDRPRRRGDAAGDPVAAPDHRAGAVASRRRRTVRGARRRLGAGRAARRAVAAAGRAGSARRALVDDRASGPAGHRVRRRTAARARRPARCRLGCRPPLPSGCTGSGSRCTRRPGSPSRSG